MDQAEVYRLACLELRGGNQMGSYAVELPGLSGWVSCHPIYSSPRGGDMYYLSSCSKGAVARVVLADVAGHGEVVSAAAARLGEVLREHVDHWDQAALIRQLNDGFLNGAGLNGAGPNGPGKVRFASAFFASYYSVSGEMLFTNAGQEPPLWYRAASREWSFLSETTPVLKEIVDLPLGLIAGTNYTQTGVQIDPGDLLLLYTDGIRESCDATGEQLGQERLLELARQLPTHSAEAAAEALLNAVERFRGAGPATDDVTVVGLQAKSLAS
jgi:sigma-B regulation protein RsbU (phosphoserine phosphatase)